MINILHFNRLSLPIIIALFLSVQAAAQNTSPKVTLAGSVVDSVTTTPVPYTSIKVTDAKSGNFIFSTVADTAGNFKVIVDTPNLIQILFTAIGYSEKIIRLKLTGNFLTLNNLSKIKMVLSSHNLTEVIIKSEKPIIKQSIDRISYNVQSDPENKVLSAFEILRKVPLISITGEDKIQMKGNSNYMILLNGRPTSLFVNDASQVLKSMPASSIERIEIITTPPSKYDAEGITGLINIVSKKATDDGYNNYIGLSENYPYGPMGSVASDFKEGKLTFSGFGSYQRQSQSNLTNGSTISSHSPEEFNITQNGINSFHGHTFAASGQLSYEIDTLNLLTATLNLNNNRFNTLNNINTINDYSNELSSNSYHLMTLGKPIWNSFDAGLNYQLGFKKNKEELLTLSYNLSKSNNYTTDDNVFSDELNNQMTNYNQFNNFSYTEHTAQVDFIKPGTKWIIETGGKAILRQNTSDYFYTGLSTAPANNFNYDQNVYSFYNSYQLQLINWGLKFGGRLEDTHTTSNEFIKNQNYLNLIPAISFQYSLKNSSVNAGYTQRISRPNIAQLNPFIDIENPQEISTGNPNLRPVLSNNFELSYSNYTTGSFYVGLSYSFINNSIQSVTVLTDTITSTTYANTGSNKSFHLDISLNRALSKNLRLNLNGGLSHVNLTGNFDGQNYENQGYQGYISTYLSYKISDSWRSGLNIQYASSSILLEGKTNSTPYSAITIAKQLLNRKLQIFLAIKNPYSRFRNSVTEIKTDQLYQNDYSQYYYRALTFSISYTFGKLTKKVKKVENGIQNDDLDDIPKRSLK